MFERCVCCGNPIPEGRMICVDCENTMENTKIVYCAECTSYKHGRCTNYKGLYGHPKPNDFCSYGTKKGDL